MQCQVEGISLATAEQTVTPLPGWAVGACSAASAAAAAVVTHPLDVVKTRLQVASAASPAAAGSASLNIARHLLATEGELEADDAAIAL